MCKTCEPEVWKRYYSTRIYQPTCVYCVLCAEYLNTKITPCLVPLSLPADFASSHSLCGEALPDYLRLSAGDSVSQLQGGSFRGTERKRLPRRLQLTAASSAARWVRWRCTPVFSSVRYERSVHFRHFSHPFNRVRRWMYVLNSLFCLWGFSLRSML